MKGIRGKLLSMVSILSFVGGMLAPAVSHAEAIHENANWIVLSGGESKDGSIMAMGFYPAVITIDAGQSVTWKGNSMEPHTITFLNGGTPPKNIMAPVGGKTFDGKGEASSGMLMQRQSYTLTFTKPGIYTYQCLFHPGMYGTVVVQSKGARLSLSQEEFNEIGAVELRHDIVYGKQAASHSHVTKSRNADGTTTWNVPTDAPLLKSWSISLGKYGVVTFTNTNGKVKVDAKLSHLQPHSTHALMIHAGTTSGPALYMLNSAKANSHGYAESVTNLPGMVPVIPDEYWVFAVHQRSSKSHILTATRVNYPNYAAMRFFPTNLTIKKGDTVNWIQKNAEEVHTVTLLESSKYDPPGDPTAAPPSGGSVFTGFNSTTHIYNSGIMIPGSSYHLKFDVTGTFKYQCLLHDVMGMVGYVTVK